MLPLFLLGQALARPHLVTSGDCPGPVDVDITGLTPFGSATVWRGWAPGMATVPFGACSGDATRLDSPTWTTAVVADAAGEVHLTVNLGATACNRLIQVFDDTTCAATNTIRAGALRDWTTSTPYTPFVMTGLGLAPDQGWDVTTTTSLGSGLVHLSRDGDVQWALSGLGTPMLRDVARTSTGDLVIAGPRDDAAYVVWFDEEGSWLQGNEYTINPGSFTDVSDLVMIDDRPVVLTIPAVLRLDTDGSVMWATAPIATGMPYRATPGEPGELVVAGPEYGSAIGRGLVAWLDLDTGSVLRSVLYSSDDGEVSHFASVARLGNGDIIATGGWGNSLRSCLVVRLSPTGALLSAEAWRSPTSTYTLCEAITEDERGNVWVGGQDDGLPGTFLLVYNPVGTFLGQVRLGADVIWDVDARPGGGVVAALSDFDGELYTMALRPNAANPCSQASNLLVTSLGGVVTTDSSSAPVSVTVDLAGTMPQSVEIAGQAVCPL